MIRILDDGSAAYSDGRILQFSVDRFLRDVVSGDCCFVCGRNPSTTEFNDEHVVPDWVLRRYDLHDKSIRLPNGAGLPYRSYKVPCCRDCNSWLGTNIEQPISQLLFGSYDEVCERVRKNQVLVFCWLALLFVKTHLRDTRLRWALDQRANSGAIGDRYRWEALHHIHCIARSAYVGASLHESVMGSMLVLPNLADQDIGPFDYGDLYASSAVMASLGDTCLLAVLDDACGSWTALEQFLSRIRGPLSAVQRREVLARLGYANQLIEDRPSYSSMISPSGHVYVEARLPLSFTLGDFHADVFGRILHNSLFDILEQIANRSQIEPQVLSGRLTFLFDDDGNFKRDSFVIRESV